MEHDPERGDAPKDKGSSGDPRIPSGQGVPARGLWERATGRNAPTESTGLLEGSKGLMQGGMEGLQGTMGAVQGLAQADLADLLTDSTTVTTYDPMAISSWEALFMYRGTIFAQKAMWSIVALQLFIMFFIAGYVVIACKDPHAYQTETVSAVVKTVSAFIGFLLGLFLSSCLNRWWDTIKAIEILFGTAKKLVVFANSVGMEHQQRDMLTRRAVLSMRFIEAEMVLTTPENWRRLFAKFRAEGNITAEEEEHLASIPADQRSFFTWTLVSKQLRGLQKSLNPLVFDRLSAIVLDGLGAVSSLKNLMCFQFPFLYMHMLAFMVHLANFLTAIGTGVTIGLLLARGRVHADVSRSHIADAVHLEPLQDMLAHVDPGQIFEAMLFFLLQTFFYQAALTIGASLSFPIGSPGASYMYRMPLEEMVSALEKNLRLINLASDAKKP